VLHTNEKALGQEAIQYPYATFDFFLLRSAGRTPLRLVATDASRFSFLWCRPACPRVTPFLGRNVCEVADAVIEAQQFPAQDEQEDVAFEDSLQCNGLFLIMINRAI
jgi:hypothetical protein